MAQQQIITKPYVEELQDNDSLFINHDGALRQIKKSSADFASGADMRAEVAAREAFEAQELAARESFEKSETEAREQFETSVGRQVAEKANIDGYYEEMTVGDAEQLVATQFVEDNEPYLFRSTGGSSDVGNRAHLDKIVGGTVAWNQLVEHGNFDAVSGWSGGTVSGNVLTITGTSDGTMNMTLSREMNIPSGHKTLAMCDVYCGSANNARIRFPFNSLSAVSVSANTWTSVAQIGISDTSMRVGVQMNGINGEIYKYRNFVLFDLTQMFGSTIADYIYSLEQATAGAGVEWFKKLFPKDYYPYNAGELLSVEGLQSHDMVGFNQWDEEWELGYYDPPNGKPLSSTDSIRSKNYIPILPNTNYYFKTNGANLYVCQYDANKEFVSYVEASNNTEFVTPSNARYIRFNMDTGYGTTYKHDICINLSSPSRNGEYEPYKKHSYPLDSSLTLRGIPKLDASNNIYYDGDEYTSDGKVKRKYDVVDLGTLDWTYYGDDKFMYAYVPRKKHGFSNLICQRYRLRLVTTDIQRSDKVCWGNTQNSILYIKDLDYTDVATFKAAMSGVMLVYELATPTTETAEPFQHIQIVDDFGTEEFVSNGFISVGHKTRYPANLRDKLQHLPSLANADGTYMIQQSGKQMSLVHMPAVFPDTPTEDGTYTLKTVVTGGVATLQWVAE